jgi:hypothetical protein
VKRFRSVRVTIKWRPRHLMVSTRASVLLPVSGPLSPAFAEYIGNDLVALLAQGNQPE